MYNIIFESFEDGQKENTKFTKPRILKYKSKGVKGVKWSHFLTTFPTMFRCQCVWKFKSTERFGWQKMQTCPLPPFCAYLIFRLAYWCPRSFLISVYKFKQKWIVKMDTVLYIIIWFFKMLYIYITRVTMNIH